MNLGQVVDRQWRAVVVIMVLLSVGGLIAMTRVPMALFPETNFPRIIIVIEDGEVPAQQVLITVTARLRLLGINWISSLWVVTIGRNRFQ